MAWRIADYIERGEIDNRTKDRIKGTLHICGLNTPIQLELVGNPYRDLAGQLLQFINPHPKPMPQHLIDIAVEQTGVVGDMTAARRVKVLDIPDDEFEHYYINKIPMPYHWGNCVYLEWHSVRNGRVVIEATDYLLEVLPEGTWQMSEAEEAAQQEANGRAMINFMDQMLEAANAAAGTEADDGDDGPQSEAEAVADNDAARMDLLMDRIMARLDREGDPDGDKFEQIMAEEQARLRRERGEPEPKPLTPEEAAEQDQRIAEINAASEAALNEPADPEDARQHPLVEHCHAFGNRLHVDIETHDWLPEGSPEEHPFNALKHGIWFATAKLAGALNGRREDWPPEALLAGDCLVRLKKARSHLRDAQRGLDAIEAEKLTDSVWWSPLRQELGAILYRVEQLIDEVRAVLGKGNF
jgi:hypothetical protein